MMIYNKQISVTLILIIHHYLIMPDRDFYYDLLPKLLYTKQLSNSFTPLLHSTEQGN